MFFLQGLFDIIENSYSESINHFPLIELIFYSIDQTLFYFIVWFIIRMVYLRFFKKNKRLNSVRREISLNGFIFYVILLVHLTIFREEHSIGNVEFKMGSLSHINLTPFVHTFKLTQGVTLFDYYYNLYGNILWFVPMGFAIPYLLNRNHYFVKTMCVGFFVSFSIETLQFFFRTGITDIDDLIFNTIGTLIGVLIFVAYRWMNKLYSKRKKEKKV